MRISAGLVIGGTFVASIATVLNAFLVNKQFYPSIVYLSKSNSSMAVIYFQLVIMVYLVFRFLRYLFFGELRAVEAEHLSERTWHAVLETCLAFTVFRDDFSPLFVMQFIALLFIKGFHWLADDRVDMMERSPVISIRFHIRMMAILACLGFTDSYMVSNAYFTTMLKGASAQIVFGFEYAILITLVVHVTIKYLLHMHDLRTAQSWDNKAVYLLYSELCINLVRCILYGAFACVMMKVHTFPLFSVRPFYSSLRALHKAFSDVILSRRAINAMNNQFPVVTAEELSAMDATCIICREEMTVDSSPKRLPCSHVFHSHCLRSWFQRQQTCPTCRTEILGRSAGAQPAAAPAAAQAQGGAPQAQPAQPPFQQQGVPMGFPFVAHQFAFPAANVPNQQQLPPHPIFYAPPPPNRPEFADLAQAAPPPPPPPPFGMMFPPVPPPPFLQPDRSDYARFSVEELRQMEGDTREAIVARLRALDDIVALVDAAEAQLVQLAAVMPLRRRRGEPAAAAAPMSTAQEEGVAPPPPTPAQGISPESSPVKEEVVAQSPGAQEEASSSQTTTSSSPSLFRNASPTVTRTPDAEEIRLKRLARFEQQPTSSISNSAQDTAETREEASSSNQNAQE